MSAELLEGSEAIARAMVSAGCKFFAGYPMTPFTEVLEGMAKLMPDAGGDCVNAESELEAIGMAWGAAAAGARAATGSVGQGLSLMQESIAELCFARVPMVVLNMARGQGDYYQATRGGGHGDYRTIVLAPVDLAEAVRLVQLAFHLADKFRNPVMFMGDYYLAHVFEAVDTGTVDFGTLPRKDCDIARATSGNPAQHFGGRRLLAPRAVDRSHLVGLEQPSPGTSPLSDAPRRCRKHRHVGSRTGGKLGRGACLSACAGCRGLRSRDRRCRAPFDVWATIGTPSVVSRSARDCPGAEGTASALVEEGRLLEPRTVLTQEWSRERSSVTFRGDVPGQRRAADSPCGSS